MDFLYIALVILVWVVGFYHGCIHSAKGYREMILDLKRQVKRAEGYYTWPTPKQ